MIRKCGGCGCSSSGAASYCQQCGSKLEVEAESSSGNPAKCETVDFKYMIAAGVFFSLISTIAFLFYQNSQISSENNKMKTVVASLSGNSKAGEGVLEISQEGSWTLAQVVNSNVLGLSQRYLESKMNAVPTSIRKDYRGVSMNSYNLKGCFIGLGVKDEVVVSVEMYVEAGKCDIDVSEELESDEKIMLSTTTFESWGKARGDWNFTALNILGDTCNACGEGGTDVFAVAEGTSAGGGVDIQIGGNSFDDEALSEGLGIWTSALRGAGIENLPVDGACPLRAFDDLAFESMKRAKVTHLAYGKQLRLEPYCNGITVQTNRITGEYIHK